MSILVYKQRFQNPNFKKTAGANYAHVRYIATRPRVMKNDSMAHGLFGRLQPGQLTDFQDWRSIASAVYANSRKGTIMYRSVLSFARETAEELNLLDQKAWKRYLEKHVAVIAEKNCIRRENFQWAAAVHNEKGHPHAHIVFWDKSEEIRNAYTPPAVPNAIRKQLIKDTFQEKIKDYIAQKEKAVGNVRQITDDQVDAFESYFRKQGGKGFRKITEQLEREIEGKYDIEESILKELGSRLLQLRRCMPEKGRLSYKLLPPKVKEEVDRFTHCLLDEVPLLAEEADRYVKAKLDMARLYASDGNYLESMEKCYRGEILTIASNRVLSGIRMVIRLEKEIKKQEYFIRRRDYYTYRICMEIMETLAEMEDERKKGHSYISGDLSKEAKKELYLKNRDKGYEH